MPSRVSTIPHYRYRTHRISHGVKEGVGVGCAGKLLLEEGTERPSVRESTNRKGFNSSIANRDYDTDTEIPQGIFGNSISLMDFHVVVYDK